MKKILTLAALTTLSLSVFGQGTIIFNNKISTTTAGVNPSALSAPIYLNTVGGTALSGTDTSATGNYLAVLLGGAASATGYSVSANGVTAGSGLSVLASPNTGATTVGFRTGAAAGFVNVGSDSPRADAAVTWGATGAFQIAAWNEGSLYTTFDQAWAAAVAGTDLNLRIGFSSLLTRPTAQSSTDTATPNLQGLTSFAIIAVPEPSSLALLGLGAAGMLIFRRRK